MKTTKSVARAGVRAAWLYTHVGETPPQELKLWEFRGGSTKINPQIIFPDTVEPNTAVWVAALWVNPTDQPGPAGTPIKAYTTHTGLNQAA
ncbi:MAG: hypothetical protein ACIAXF_05920 [Phycisphaerales bacterium JB063]